MLIPHRFSGSLATLSDLYLSPLPPTSSILPILPCELVLPRLIPQATSQSTTAPPAPFPHLYNPTISTKQPTREGLNPKLQQPLLVLSPLSQILHIKMTGLPATSPGPAEHTA